MPRGTPSDHATITIKRKNRLFLADRNIPLSTFVNQQIEAFANSNSDHLVFMIATEIKSLEEETKRKKDDLKNRGFPDYQTILTAFEPIILDKEEKGLKLLGAELRKYRAKDLRDPKQHQGILSWIENRSKDFGLNRPAPYILEQVLKQEAEA